MDNELKKLLIENFAQGKNFILEQSPDVIQQYLSSEMLSYSIGMVISSVVIIIMTYILFMYRKNDNQDDSMGVQVPFTIALFSCAMFLANLHDFITIYFYPKAYLLKILL